MAPPNREVQTNVTPNDSAKAEPIDASTVFLAQVQNDRAPKTAEQTRDVVKAPAELLSAVRPGETAFYPNQLVAEAQQLSQKMTDLMRSGKQSTDIIPVTDANGNVQQMTVGDRITQMRDLLNKDCQTAIIASNELIKNNPNLESDLNRTTAQLQTAAQKAGLDYNSPAFAQQAANNPELQPLVKQQELLQAARFAPATAMMTYAMLKAQGYTENPEQSMDNFKLTGMPKPSTQELTDAFMLVNQAGRIDKEVPNSPMFQSANASIKAVYAETQSDKGREIVKLIADGDKLKGSEAEEKYKQAWQLGETIDQKFLAAQLKLQDNQSNPDVKNALVGILVDVKEARCHYATALNARHSHDGLPILLSVAADTPELVRQDPTFNKLVSEATFTNGVMTDSQINVHQTEFITLMNSKDPDRFTKAQADIKALNENYANTKEQLDAGRPALDAAKKAVDDKLAELDKKKDSTDATEFKIEQTRLQSEKQAIEMTQGQNDAFLKKGTFYKYLEGQLFYAQDKKDQAHDLFEQVKKEDPELAANKDLHVDELLEATKHQNWFQRNWHAIATGLAIGAGVCVGLLLSPTGPLAVGAGLGTTAAICAAIGGGALAGGLVYSGTKGAALGFDKVGIRDFGQGALLGASGALPVSGLFGGGAAVLEGGGTIAAESAGTASTAAVWGGRAVSAFSKMGITGRSLAVGSTLAAGDEGMKVAFDGKSWTAAAKDFAWEAPLAAASFGLASAAATPLKQVLTIGMMNGASPAMELGVGTYMQAQEHVLDPNNPKENQMIWDRYNALNPVLYRPETPVKSGDQPQPAQPQRKQLTQDEIDRLRNQDITDEPVK